MNKIIGFLYWFMGRLFARFACWTVSSDFVISSKKHNPAQGDNIIFNNILLREAKLNRIQDLCYLYNVHNIPNALNSAICIAYVQNCNGLLNSLININNEHNRKEIPETFIWRCWQNFNSLGTPETYFKALGEKIATESELKDIVVVCLSNGFFDVIDIWMDCYEKNRWGEVVFLCFDNESLLKVKARGYRGVHLFEKSKITESSTAKRPPNLLMDLVWVARTNVILGILLSGKNVLQCDGDAFWYSCPSKLWSDSTDVDAYFQIDISIPRDIQRSWGFILCCGFYYIKNSPSSIAFYQDFVEVTRRYMHDQIGLNVYLHELGTRWIPSEDGGYSAKTPHGLQIVGLNKNVVSRNLETGSVIRHPVISGHDLDKVRRTLMP